MSKKIGKLARRYARALLGAVEQELGKTGIPSPAQQVGSALKEFADAWQANADLPNSLLSPSFSREERIRALRGIAKSLGMSEVAARFLITLCERDRLGAVVEVIDSFRELADRAAGVVQVEIKTAREVSQDEAGQIEGSLKQRISGTPIFKWSVDNKLLGGIVVTFDGRVLDGSVSGRLERLERSLNF